MDPQDTFLAQFETVERIIATIGRRHGLAPDDFDDFASQVKLKLVEHDYAVFRKFQGRSSLATFLTVVITNFFRDYRTAKWGRWRPSAEAKRLGEVAIRLETLLYRDGLPVSQAIATLRRSGGELPAEAELSRIAAQLPPRTKTRLVDGIEAETVEAPDRADTRLAEAELLESRDATLRDVEAALGTLAPEDQLIVRMRFLDGFSVADIARTLRLEQKPLYRRIDHNLGRLRSFLEGRGVDRQRVALLLSE